VVDLAGNADIYAGVWSGLKATYDFSNQTAAVDVLLGGIEVDNTTDSASPPLMNTTMPIHHNSPVGAIVGGAIGGSIVLFMMLVLLVLILRQRRRRIATAAALPKPSEEPSRASIQITDRHDDRQIQQAKHPMPPLNGNPSTAIVRDDGGLQETRQVIQAHAETHGITIGSLLWDLNELLRRGNRVDGEESPPVYSTIYSNSTDV
jgi:hypothetical protein